MKKISIVCLTGLLFFTACENTGSSTVGTYDKEETLPSSEKSESEKVGGEEKTESATADTLKNTTDTTNTGANNKMGTSVSADSSK